MCQSETKTMTLPGNSVLPTLLKSKYHFSIVTYVDVGQVFLFDNRLDTSVYII